jgi:hypothetical protein
MAADLSERSGTENADLADVLTIAAVLAGRRRRVWAAMKPAEREPFIAKAREVLGL